MDRSNPTKPGNWGPSFPARFAAEATRAPARHAPMRRRFAAFALACASLTPIASAQTITDGDATFQRTTSSFDATPLANFRGVAATLASDQMYETGWAYRTGGDTREFFLPLPSTQNFAGDTSTMTWSDIAGRGLLDARETVRVIDRDGPGGGSPSGQVEMTLEVTNRSASPLVVGLFHLADLDVDGDGANDAVTLLRPGPNPTIGIADGAVSAQYRGIGANRWEVRNFNNADGVAGLLDDALLTTLSNAGAPGGPFDFTGGMQWNDRTLAPGASFSVSVTFAINAIVTKPELFVIKSNDVGGSTSVDEIFAWELQLINSSHSPTATFAPGQVLLRDQLPSSDLVYDAAVVTPVFGASGTIDCDVVVADLVCTAATAVSIPAGASFRVALPAGPIATGSFVNPRAGGACSIDPEGRVDEEIETNNGCAANTVVVVGAPVFGDGFEPLPGPRPE